LGGNLGEHRFVFEQAYAEALQAVQAGGFGGRLAAQQARPARIGSSSTPRISLPRY
jgi:hypothetical protein